MTTLLSDIEAFLGTHDISPTRFGDEAMADRHFVKQLRKGRRVWPETEAKARRFMATYLPAERTPATQPDQAAA